MAYHACAYLPNFCTNRKLFVEPESHGVQEYNICFTTVARPNDDSIPSLPPPPEGDSLAPLPTVIHGLVQRRKEVKARLKSATGVSAQQLDIQ